MKLELGYRAPAATADRKVQRALAWEAPLQPTRLKARVPRWNDGPTWTPPGTILLVRHRGPDGRRLVTNDRIAPAGFEIEYDLGLVHSFGQPGTQRVVGTDDGFFCTPFEGELADSLRSLGYVETAPLPMLDALELRRNPDDGRPTLVAGSDDPLYETSERLGVVGFIESYPLNPRRAPDLPVNRLLLPLHRWAEEDAWHHRYGIDERPSEGAVCLGSVARRSLEGALMELRWLEDGRLESDLLRLSGRTARPSVQASVRWAAAPVAWARGPRAWGMRASARRVLRLPSAAVRPTHAAGATVLGHLAREPMDGWSPLFAATHPVLHDQFVTRSELEASDLGYVVDGVLGYVSDRGADRTLEAQPHEIRWASRFGQRRRYVEGPLGGGAADLIGDGA